MGKIVTENYECNGTQIGFKVKINGEYLKTRNGVDRLFTNVEFAKAIAYNNGAQSGRDYDIDLYIYGSIIPYDCIQKVAYGKLEFFANNDKNELIRYVIKETYLTEYSNFGYICFDKGDQFLTERDSGIKRAKTLKRIMINSIDKLSKLYNTVSDVIVYDKGIQVKFYHTTATLDIMSNSGLMDINQWRKDVVSEEPGFSRCFPFIKMMDKFVTFYTFIGKEMYEPSKKNSSSSIAKQFRDCLIDDLIQNWSTYNKNTDEKCKEPPSFHSVYYKVGNKILSN